MVLKLWYWFRLTHFISNWKWLSLSIWRLQWLPKQKIEQCSHPYHYSDVIMNTMASQITGVSTVCSNFCSCADQRKHRISASLAFVRGIHWWPVDSPHKWPVTRKVFQLMRSSCDCGVFLLAFNAYFPGSLLTWSNMIRTSTCTTARAERTGLNVEITKDATHIEGLEQDR